MNNNEKKILFIIRYTPIAINLIIASLFLMFLYLNYIQIFNKYAINISLLIVLIITISLFVSFYISKYLENIFISYKKSINEEIEKNKKKDLILFQQSKMATLGELLRNIAHQWRQPLTVITTAVTGILINKELGNFTNEEEKKYLDTILKNTNYLSETIDDFRNFYTQNTPKKEFSLNDVIISIDKIIGIELSTKNIKFEKDIENYLIFGIENELIQVILNLVNNSKDQFESNESFEKIISIKSEQRNNKTIIKILDNAGGINEQFITKIFEPYFTTKHQSKGTGIGLYMSQEIINKHFNGKIYVQNIESKKHDKTYKGACFTIEIPI